MPGRTRTTITQTTIRPPTNDLSKTVEPGHTLHWKGVLPAPWGRTNYEGGTEFAHQKNHIRMLSFKTLIIPSATELKILRIKYSINIKPFIGCPDTN